MKIKQMEQYSVCMSGYMIISMYFFSNFRELCNVNI